MQKTVSSLLLVLCVFVGIATAQHSHQNGAATYLGNEALMVEHEGSKILFDPFFHNNYNNYQLVPKSIVSALFSDTEPYNDIDAIFVSHDHGDHFSAELTSKFLLSHPDTKLVAPSQAVDSMRQIKGFETLQQRIYPITLERNDPPISEHFGSISFDVVRIPHAGWPQRANISNLVFRVSLNDTITVVHMGDADPNDHHFAPYKDHWQKQSVSTAFPPYWFFLNDDGRMILKERINAQENIGVHVPINVPSNLQHSGQRFFSKPSQEVPVSPHDKKPNNHE